MVVFRSFVAEAPVAEDVHVVAAFFDDGRRRARAVDQLAQHRVLVGGAAVTVWSRRQFHTGS